MGLLGAKYSIRATTSFAGSVRRHAIPPLRKCAV